LSALDELREGLREAASRDVEANRARSRRRRWQATGLLVLALLGGGAAATATDLISVGEPVPDAIPQGARYRPAAGERRQITVTTSAGAELPFGVAVYDATNGDRCALAGVIRGVQIGILIGDEFRPYPADRPGACRDHGRMFLDWVTVAGRALLYGRASPGTRAVRLRETGQSFPVGADGAFLFVFDARRRLNVDELE
jgi:hypothetical protein